MKQVLNPKSIRLAIFLVVSVVWLSISHLYFVFISRYLIDSFVDPPSTEASYLGANGPSNWWVLLLYLSLPFVISSVIYLVTVTVIYLVTVTRFFIGKQFLLLAFILSVIISGLFFPKKVFYVNIPAPPETVRSVFTYSRGDIGYPDSAEALFLTRANLDQIISFYESKLSFQEGELERLKEDVRSNPSSDDYEFYYLNGDVDLSIHVAYPEKNIYAVVFSKL